MDLPSGDQRALSASVEMFVSFLALRVAGSKAASHTCCKPERLLRKRMRLPSGANCTPPSPGWATVRGFASPDSDLVAAMGWINNSAVLVFWSRLIVVTE